MSASLRAGGYPRGVVCELQPGEDSVLVRMQTQTPAPARKQMRKYWPAPLTSAFWQSMLVWPRCWFGSAESRFTSGAFMCWWHMQDDTCICLGTQNLGVIVYCLRRNSCIHVHNVGGSVRWVVQLDHGVAGSVCLCTPASQTVLSGSL